MAFSAGVEIDGIARFWKNLPVKKIGGIANFPLLARQPPCAMFY